MKRIASTFGFEERKSIYEEYLKVKNKTAVADMFSVSARTVGRIVDEFSGKIQTATDEPAVESEHVVDAAEPASNYQYFVVGTPNLLNITRVDLTGNESSVSQIVHETSEKFEQTRALLMEGKLEEAYNLNDEAVKIKTITQGKMTLDPAAATLEFSDPDTGHVYTLPADLTERAIQMYKEGGDCTGLLNFAERLMDNPDPQVVRDLFKFLNATDIEITREGMVRCYKKVTNDFKDVYTRTIDNSVGATPTMKRMLVTKDSAVTCAEGLHVCSRAYLSSYGGDRIVMVEVDPADFVSIPDDYYSYDGVVVRAKARVCKYKVVEECTYLNLDGTPKQ